MAIDVREAVAQERRPKVLMKAPCQYEEWSDTQNKDIYVYPAVSCSFDCAHCGWNPEVKAKRVEKMLAEIAARRKVK